MIVLSALVKFTDTCGLTATLVSGQDGIVQHNRNSNVLEIKLQDFDLADDQTLHVAFASAIDGDEASIIQVNDVLVPYVDGKYAIVIPPEVLSHRGTWCACFAIKSGLDVSTGEYDWQARSPYVSFDVKASIRDTSGNVPSDADIASLYLTAVNAVQRVQQISAALEKKYGHLIDGNG